MLAEHTPYFIECYYKHMNKEVKEITEDVQKKIISYFNTLATDVDNFVEDNLDENSTRSRALDLGFHKKVEGSLTGPKKLEFIMLVRRNINELLPSDAFNHNRHYKAALLCKESNIKADVYTKWLPHISKKRRNRYSYQIIL